MRSRRASHGSVRPLNCGVSRTMFERIALIAATWIALYVVGCGSAEVPSTYYDSYELALSDGAMSRGWIPMWLPRTSSEIREAHSVETNQSMLAFKFDGAEVLEANGTCSQIGPLDPG